MKFDPFVMPFTIGLAFMAIVLVYRYFSWYLLLSANEKSIVKANFFTKRTISGIKEIFNESLFHRKIYAKSWLLGYMHMSLAFGWFLLIIIGHLETSAYFGKAFEAPYIPIFLRFFQKDATHHTAQVGYWFIMDTLLLFILSGVFLAWYKRRKAKKFGMNRTTKHAAGDRIALTVLWFIFPLRLVAESITSIIYGGGSYLTFGLGSLMEGNIANEHTFYFAWWAYSVSLGIFFIFLPFSRYMHIPTEVGLIMLRNWGLKSEKGKMGCVSKFELHSCSSCGICLDTCQLTNDLHSCYSQAPYLYKSIRNVNLTDAKLNDCLMCGRCEISCVVGISNNNLRQAIRNKVSLHTELNLNYIEDTNFKTINKADVVYFAGCMSHLTPGIKRAMESIFKAASINFAHLDQYESVCCGRPMMLAGMKEQALPLINKNKEFIAQSGAKKLVTSCPICYKVFKEEYNLEIEVLHHTVYLQNLINSGQLRLQKSDMKIVYHDPCELGRGSGIYEAPRQVIKRVASLQKTEFEKEKALCCGGSLANTILTSSERNILANATLKKITNKDTQSVVTACPLCKKTFASAQKEIPIKDIAEIIEMNLLQPKVMKAKSIKETSELVLNNP